MKITLSSPDGLGDFILRVPMIRALLDAGHEMQLFLRNPAADLAASVFPEIKIHLIAADPFLPSTRRQKNPFQGEMQAIRKFGPDLYIAALFSINFFDQIWLEQRMSEVKCAGFHTGEPFWPSTTTANPVKLSSKWDLRLEVPVAMPELEKNRLMASAIIGRDLPHSVPDLMLRPDSRESAGALLARHGLEPGEYWAVCVGTRPGLMKKDWGEDNWTQFFSTILPDEPLVFFGNTKEYSSIERIRAGLPSSARTINLADSPPPLNVTLALVAQSKGYLGRDSGVMHLASAARRSILAIYGGSHWGRFLPSRGPAVVTTRAVPCRGCDFSCPYEKPWCISDVAMETMCDAWKRLPSADGVEVIEQGSGRTRQFLEPEDIQNAALAVQSRRQHEEEGDRSKGWRTRLAETFLGNLKK